MATGSFAANPSLKITASERCSTEDLTPKSRELDQHLRPEHNAIAYMGDRDIFYAVLKLELPSTNVNLTRLRPRSLPAAKTCSDVSIFYHWLNAKFLVKGIKKFIFKIG